jgi:hypothetical protein
MKVLVFTGPHGAGKTTTGYSFEKKYNHLFGMKVSVAAPLKELVCDIYTNHGFNLSLNHLNNLKIKEDLVNYQIVATKEDCETINYKFGIPMDFLLERVEGLYLHSIRHAMQFLGTEVIRDYDELAHTKMFVGFIRLLEDTCETLDFVWVDDVNFPNEWEALIKKHEVFLVYIDNDVDAPENVAHASQSHRGYFKHRADLILKKSKLLTNEDEQLARIFKLMEPVHGS